VISGNLGALLRKRATDSLGLIDGDEGVFDEEVCETALVGIGGLLLLLATEFDFGLGCQTHVNDNATNLGIEVSR